MEEDLVKYGLTGVYGGVNGSLLLEVNFLLVVSHKGIGIDRLFNGRIGTSHSGSRTGERLAGRVRDDNIVVTVSHALSSSTVNDLSTSMGRRELTAPGPRLYHKNIIEEKSDTMNIAFKTR